MRLRTDSAAATKRVAASLAPLLRAGDVVLLSGDLGAGKTVFVQGLAAALGVDEPVTSPTFTLAAVYRHGRLPLHHLDAYRLERLSEVLDLDLPGLLDDDAVVCIEWGEVLVPELPRDFLAIRLRLADVGEPADVRTIETEFVGPSWTDRARLVTNALAAAAGGNAAGAGTTADPAG
ncbi:MAG TPA: tRNA (adenosine(37)-N6)-threonylcarbamoyltransferase complex ATPase subunit type 1 TsaE, partial [Acidimicrobiaceae bacterium]|nr:tRNA (adenosine(37)-N6)-threonylcarbamoyltransferase complex ATPase subunit type 1 TsaE [Acidimicrobiaceae bacterium]